MKGEIEAKISLSHLESRALAEFKDIWHQVVDCSPRCLEGTDQGSWQGPSPLSFRSQIGHWKVKCCLYHITKDTAESLLIKASTINKEKVLSKQSSHLDTLFITNSSLAVNCQAGTLHQKQAKWGELDREGKTGHIFQPSAPERKTSGLHALWIVFAIYLIIHFVNESEAWFPLLSS